MRIELVAGTGNVVRFPVERRARPTLELLRDITPDVRELLLLAESFDLGVPGAELRYAVDEEMADYILNHVRPEPGPARRAALEGLLAPLVERAIAACRAAHDASLAATEAQQRVVAAHSEGGYWLEPIEEKADRLTVSAAQLLVEAYIRTEEAEGAARAVGLAKRGEPWTAVDHEADADALFFSARKTA